jgi:hypothetical protein
VTCDPRLARDPQLQLWPEHLERSVEDVSCETRTSSMCCGARSPASSSSAKRRGEPQTYRLPELARASRRAIALAGLLHGLLVDAESGRAIFAANRISEWSSAAATSGDRVRGYHNAGRERA